MVGFQIGYLEFPKPEQGIGTWNFCVRKRNDTLFLYVGNLGEVKDGEKRGSGQMTYCEGDLTFENLGGFEGSVLNSVMDYFAPMVYWAAKQKNFPINKIKIDFSPPDPILFRKDLKRWEDLGFPLETGRIQYDVKDNTLYRSLGLADKDSLEERVR